MFGLLNISDFLQIKYNPLIELGSEVRFKIISDFQFYFIISSISLLITAVIILVIYLIRLFIDRLLINKKTRKIVPYTIYAIFSCYIVYIVVLNMIDIAGLRSKSELIISNTLICLFLLVSVLFIQIINKYHIVDDENENLKAYSVAVDGNILELRRFRHNYLNILNTMFGYITTDDMNGLEVYFNQVLNQSESMRNLTLSGLEKIMDLPLKSILAIKLNNATSKNISIEVYVPRSFKMYNIELCDLCEMLGVFLDNAIEECEKVLEKTPKILVSFERDYENSIITIENTYHEKPELSDLYKMGVSTKGENRGVGLVSVQKIIERHKNDVTLNTRLDEEKEYFVQELKIKRN